MTSLLTWNCQNLKSNGGFLSSFRIKYDFIFLQETWLYSFETNALDQFTSDYCAYHCSAMPSTGVRKGRPSGGLAILYKKSLQTQIKHVDFRDTRLMGVIMNTSAGELLLINVYLPVNSAPNDELINKYISKIELVSAEHNGPVIIAGDFNLSPKQLNFTTLEKMCSDNMMKIMDFEILPKTTYTFCSKGLGNTSWPDHVITSKDLNVLSCSVISTPNPSDHFPVQIKINVVGRNCIRPNDTKVAGSQKLNWKKLPEHFRKMYANVAESSLLDLLSRVELCEETKCSDKSHLANIDTFFDELVERLMGAEENVKNKYQSKLRKFKDKTIPGWNRNVKSLYAVFRDHYLNWLSSSKKDSVEFDLMKSSRLKFRRELIKCRQQRDKKMRDELALEYSGKNFVKFWSMIRQYEKADNAPITCKLDGKTTPTEICNLWADNFEALFNCNDDNRDKDPVLEFIKSSPKDRVNLFTSDIVLKAVSELKRGKARGSEGICAEQLIHAATGGSNALCYFFNTCISHGYLPQRLMYVQIVPIMKSLTWTKKFLTTTDPSPLPVSFQRFWRNVF